MNCKNRYETLYLTESSDANTIEDTGNISSTDGEFCFDKKKSMGKRNEYTPRKKYPEPVPKSKFASRQKHICKSQTRKFQQ